MTDSTPRRYWIQFVDNLAHAMRERIIDALTKQGDEVQVCKPPMSDYAEYASIKTDYAIIWFECPEALAMAKLANVVVSEVTRTRIDVYYPSNQRHEDYIGMLSISIYKHFQVPTTFYPWKESRIIGVLPLKYDSKENRELLDRLIEDYKEGKYGTAD